MPKDINGSEVTEIQVKKYAAMKQAATLCSRMLKSFSFFFFMFHAS